MSTAYFVQHGPGTDKQQLPIHATDHRNKYGSHTYFIDELAPKYNTSHPYDHCLIQLI
jgi:hypothetical protein